MGISALLIQIIFGWPTIIVAILLSIAGVWFRKSALLIVSGIISVPFAYYLSAGFQTAAILLPFFHFGAAYFITRKDPRIAWLLISPMIIMSAMLAYLVLTQPGPN